jgi:hypothetical protein
MDKSRVSAATFAECANEAKAGLRKARKLIPRHGLKLSAMVAV